MENVKAFLKRDLFQLNGFHVTFGAVLLVVVIVIVWKIARKR